MGKGLWIIQNTLSMIWEDFTPTCFYKCSLIIAPEDKERLDQYAIKVVGDEPAEFGYVKIEGDGNVCYENNTIAFPVNNQEELDFVYSRVADALLNHPGVIDLRGRKIRII